MQDTVSDMLNISDCVLAHLYLVRGWADHKVV